MKKTLIAIGMLATVVSGPVSAAGKVKFCVVHTVAGIVYGCYPTLKQCQMYTSNKYLTCVAQ